MGDAGDRFSGSTYQGRAVVGTAIRIIFPPCHLASPLRQTGPQASSPETRVRCPTCDRAWTVSFAPSAGGGQVAWWQLAYPG
jgi:transposase-like protein